jgi:VanZ family protein
LYALAIFAASSMPNPPAPPASLTDKHVHLVVFGGLALLLFRALSPTWPPLPSMRPALHAIALTVAYGASDEWHQAYVPGRHADLEDLAADAAGACLAMLLAWVVASRRRGRRARVAPAGEL